MLFVEHDMDMVHDISDWVIVMAEGRVIAEGTPDDIAANPAVIDAYLGAHQGQSLLEDELDEPTSRRRTWERPDEAEPTAARAADGRSADRCSRRRPRRRLHPRGQHPQRLQPRPSTRASSSASSAPTAPASRRCSRRSSACARCASGTVTLGGRDITGHKAHELVGARRRLRAAERATCSRRLTVRENLEMGCYLAKRRFDERFEYVTDAVPAARRAGRRSGPGRCRAASARWWRWAGR